jgi:hypothetical protein
MTTTSNRSTRSRCARLLRDDDGMSTVEYAKDACASLSGWRVRGRQARRTVVGGGAATDHGRFGGRGR